MARIREWLIEIGKLSKEEKQKYFDALDTLKSWEFFWEEFRLDGIRGIRMALKERLKQKVSEDG